VSTFIPTSRKPRRLLTTMGLGALVIAGLLGAFALGRLSVGRTEVVAAVGAQKLVV
jgi:hypothetical protein